MADEMSDAQIAKHAAEVNAQAEADYNKDPNHPKWKPAGRVSAEKAKTMVGGATAEEVADYEKQQKAKLADTQADERTRKEAAAKEEGKK